MIHGNERKAFLRGAEAMRANVADTLEASAGHLQEIGAGCRLETDRLLLTLEAKALTEQAAAVRAMSLPEFGEAYRCSICGNTYHPARKPREGESRYCGPECDKEGHRRIDAASRKKRRQEA